MKWSKYSFSEKLKIIKSKITHNNIICVALHTYDLELFEKILITEKIKDINTMFLVHYGLCEGDKYYIFLQKIYNYLNENDVILDKEKEQLLDYVLKYIEIFDPLKFTKNEQLQPCYNDEDTLEYYDRTSKNLSVNNTNPTNQIGESSELNYADLDWTS
ncbi:hypothetical protein [Rickettsia endosymbiont of Gonocerus acuteangulatus]|uniref:hypothetical protein n=1 Tax=Rickettsia endosymbiont of Gonocerus acuteangulatus TaxID=3066266 RepID=UPI003132FD7C